MTATGRLRAYNWAVEQWKQGILTEREIDLLVRTRWITKEEGEQIKTLPQNKTEAQ